MLYQLSYRPIKGGSDTGYHPTVWPIPRFGLLAKGALLYFVASFCLRELAHFENLHLFCTSCDACARAAVGPVRVSVPQCGASRGGGESGFPGCHNALLRCCDKPLIPGALRPSRICKECLQRSGE